MKNQEFIGKLIKWIDKNKNRKDLWIRTKIGLQIKALVKYRRNWKNAPRGLPKVGFDLMIKARNGEYTKGERAKNKPIPFSLPRAKTAQSNDIEI